MRSPAKPTSALRRVARRGAAIACVAATWGIVACGSATVDGNSGGKDGNNATGTEQSVAPLDRGQSSSESPNSEDPSSESSSAEPSSKSKGGNAAEAGAGAGAGAGEDRGAREVDDIPEPEDNTSPEDKKYLDFLNDKKVDTKDAEGQITSAAMTVCSEDTVTLPAVAGQLIAQERTDMEHGELVRLMTDEAQEIYC